MNSICSWRSFIHVRDGRSILPEHPRRHQTFVPLCDEFLQVECRCLPLHRPLFQPAAGPLFERVAVAHSPPACRTSPPTACWNAGNPLVFSRRFLVGVVRYKTLVHRAWKTRWKRVSGRFWPCKFGRAKNVRWKETSHAPGVQFADARGAHPGGLVVRHAPGLRPGHHVEDREREQTGQQGEEAQPAGFGGRVSRGHR